MMASQNPRLKVTKIEKCSQPKAPGALRLLCFSDTHEKHLKIPPHQIVPCDICICVGDFTKFGDPAEVKKFKDWFIKIPARYRVLIAGNHETTFDVERYGRMVTQMRKIKSDLPRETAKSIVQTDGIIYLENESVEIEGLKIYGSPQTHYWEFWAFYYPDKDGPKVWAKIPHDTDILVCHTCPRSTIDLMRGQNVGCKSLANAIKEVQPSLVIYGHLHEGYGVAKIGKSVIANVSLTNLARKLANRPMIFDVSFKTPEIPRPLPKQPEETEIPKDE